MKGIFVDTGAFVAKEIIADQHHESAVRGWAGARDFRLYSSEHVLDESATLIARRTTYAWAAEWGADVLEAGIEWLRTEDTDRPQAFALMKKYADQGVSFTDCLSFLLMKRAGIRSVFGFDRHFEAAGFRLWLQ